MKFMKPLHRAAMIFVLAAAWGLTGCGRTVDPHAAWREVVTQVSTYPALSEGHYAGQLSVSNLLAYGDTGLGTFDGLDGELVLSSGVVYRVAADGSAAIAPLNDTVPFAQVTWLAPDVTYDVMAMDQRLFQSTMGWKQPDAGRIQAIRVTGHFDELRVRSVPRQPEPYPPLEKVVAEQQVEHTLRNVDGAMVGFHSPATVGGISPAGFHLHFISADGSTGGHVLDFKLAIGRIEIDETPALHVLLPDRSAQ